MLNLDPALYHDFCSQLSWVEKTVQFWVEDETSLRHYRIEVLYTPESTTPYTVAFYIQQEAEFGPVWTQNVEFPAILTAKSADQALSQALSVFGERWKKRPWRR